MTNIGTGRKGDVRSQLPGAVVPSSRRHCIQGWGRLNSLGAAENYKFDTVQCSSVFPKFGDGNFCSSFLISALKYPGNAMPSTFKANFYAKLVLFLCS